MEMYPMKILQNNGNRDFVIKSYLSNGFKEDVAFETRSETIF